MKQKNFLLHQVASGVHHAKFGMCNWGRDVHLIELASAPDFGSDGIRRVVAAVSFANDGFDAFPSSCQTFEHLMLKPFDIHFQQCDVVAIVHVHRKYSVQTKQGNFLHLRRLKNASSLKANQTFCKLGEPAKYSVSICLCKTRSQYSCLHLPTRELVEELCVFRVVGCTFCQVPSEANDILQHVSVRTWLDTRPSTTVGVCR